MKTITYSREAAKALVKMPANTARLIRSKIEQYATDPASLSNNVKALKGASGFYRLRVGDWRVVFGDDGLIISIVKIASRGEVYD